MINILARMAAIAVAIGLAVAFSWSVANAALPPAGEEMEAPQITFACFYNVGAVFDIVNAETGELLWRADEATLVGALRVPCPEGMEVR